MAIKEYFDIPTLVVFKDVFEDENENEKQWEIGLGYKDEIICFDYYNILEIKDIDEIRVICTAFDNWQSFYKHFHNEICDFAKRLCDFAKKG